MITTLLTAAALAATPAPVSSELRAGSNGVLAGTLLLPAGKASATMLIIPGSGPTDRDGNNPLGVTSASYRRLAEALAERGIATVRIDKRGMFGSAGAGDPNRVRIADYVADSAAWAAAARAATAAPCVWLAGHSEGGLVALAAAGGANVCGIVLLAVPGRRLGDILRDQLRANPANAPLLAQAEAALAELEAGRRVDVSGMPPALASGLFAPAVQDYLIDLLKVDPAQLAAEVRRPMLIVQGGRDIQVGTGEGERLRAAAPAARHVLLARMNHVLVDAPEDLAGNLATYADPARPLTAGLADLIAAFVTGDRR